MSEMVYNYKTIKKWFKFALEDLQTAKLVYEADKSKIKQIGFLSQQSIEKSMKGYICFLGLKNKNTHNLSDLARMIIAVNPEHEEVLAKTVSFSIFVAFRYPDAFEEEPILKFAEDALTCAEIVFKKLSAQIPFDGALE